MAVLTLLSVPTLEPVQVAIADAMTANLPTALTQVNALFPTTLPLRPPRDVAQATVTQWDLVRNWPTLSIDGFNLRPTETSEQGIPTEWRGHIELLYFERYRDFSVLGLMLHRYAAALWAVVTAASFNDELEGAHVLPLSVVIESNEPSGSSATDRAVMVAFDVEFRT